MEICYITTKCWNQCLLWTRLLWRTGTTFLLIASAPTVLHYWWSLVETFMKQELRHETNFCSGMKSLLRHMASQSGSTKTSAKQSIMKADGDGQPLCTFHRRAWGSWQVDDSWISQARCESNITITHLLGEEMKEGCNRIVREQHRTKMQSSSCLI